MSDPAQVKVSPYTLLSRWFMDGSRTTKIPQEVIDSKAITPFFLLYYFQASPYILYISKHFNNYGLLQMPREEVYHFIKECVLRTGFKPPFVQKIKAVKSEIVECLRSHYVFLKDEEIHMLVKIIDESSDKDAIYEMFGIYKPKTKKLTKAEQKLMQQENLTVTTPVDKKEVSLTDLLGNFS